MFSDIEMLKSLEPIRVLLLKSVLLAANGDCEDAIKQMNEVDRIALAYRNSGRATVGEVEKATREKTLEKFPQQQPNLE